jgi:ABC-type transport system involved in multi-copper enzyme maturation permease subunit
MQVLTIARLTLLEASRRKLMIALLAITVAVIGLTVWGFSRIPTLEGPNNQRISADQVKVVTSQLLILVMFAYSFVLALSAVFMAAPSVAGEIESGVALAMLTRPISRAELLLGKWLGMSVLAAVYIAGASLIEFFLTNLATGYSPPHPFLFIGYLVWETVIILSLAILISTRVSSVAGGVTALGLFFMAWLGGIAFAIGQAFNNDGIRTAGTISRLLLPTDGIWHGALYALEPAAVISATEAVGRSSSSNPFFASAGPPLSFLGWSAAWVIAMLALSAVSFRRREI